MSFREQQRSQLTSRNLSSLVPLWVLKFMDSETLTGDKEGFLLLKPCSVALGGPHRSTALRPSLDGLLEAEGLCGPLLPEPRMSPCGTVQRFCFCGLVVYFHTTVRLCCELRRFSVRRAELLEDLRCSSCGETGQPTASVCGMVRLDV